MKVIVNKPVETQQKIVVDYTAPYKPPKKSFLKKFIITCINDIKSWFPKRTRTYEWDGKTIPKIEPKYK